ncbi:hypothetical protein FNV43_RR02548 [Rhamnella rubrinervis]|uniref:PGG domain-containing protein n=1 Tax=Rhamnella rubrinervis TaxID=2594499 RepID=A0A8K0HTQ8_9ROSA|nr:hypothetical protein FNV43_RR02548 [Rhamnella rubrinervis]
MIITHKEPDLYRAAVKGQIDVFMNNKGHFKCLVTPTKNTILHIYIKARSTEGTPISTRFVEEILHKCPPLFMQVNITEETPLHIAARYGHASIMKVLIKHAKSLQTEVCRDMMRMRNNKQDTALHDPLQFKHLGVAWMLAKEDDEVVYFVNDADETTVPIAVKGGPRISFHSEDCCELVNSEGISEDILHIIQTHGEQCIQNACTSSNNNENRTGITDSEVDKANKDAILVVSALIATVTVAAAFTLPGGYVSEEGQEQGAAILRKNAAFKAFIISDTIAMVCCSCAVFIHLFLALQLEERRSFSDFVKAFRLTILQWQQW